MFVKGNTLLVYMNISCLCILPRKLGLMWADSALSKTASLQYPTASLQSILQVPPGISITKEILVYVPGSQQVHHPARRGEKSFVEKSVLASNIFFDYTSTSMDTHECIHIPSYTCLGSPEKNVLDTV